MAKNFGLTDDAFRKLIGKLNDGGDSYRDYYNHRVKHNMEKEKPNQKPRGAAAIDLIDSSGSLSVFANVSKYRSPSLRAIIEYYADLPRFEVNKIREALKAISRGCWDDCFVKLGGDTRKCAEYVFKQGSMRLSNIWEDTPKIQETSACNIAIDYYLPKEPYPKTFKLDAAQEVWLRQILSGPIDYADWKEQVYRWKSKPEAAQRMLTDYQATDKFWKELPAPKTKAALDFVIDFYTNITNEESKSISATDDILLVPEQRTDLLQILDDSVSQGYWNELVKKNYGFKVDTALQMLSVDSIFANFWQHVGASQENCACYTVVNYFDHKQADHKEDNPVVKTKNLSKAKADELAEMLKQYNVDGDDWADGLEGSELNKNKAVEYMLTERWVNITAFYKALKPTEKTAARKLTIDYLEKMMSPNQVQHLEDLLGDFIESVDRFFINHGPTERSAIVMLEMDKEFKVLGAELKTDNRLKDAAAFVMEYHNDNTINLTPNEETELRECLDDLALEPDPTIPLTYQVVINLIEDAVGSEDGEKLEAFWNSLDENEVYDAVRVVVDFFKETHDYSAPRGMTNAQEEKLEELLGERYLTIDKYFINYGVGRLAARLMLTNEAPFKSMNERFTKQNSKESAIDFIIEKHAAWLVVLDTKTKRELIKLLSEAAVPDDYFPAKTAITYDMVKELFDNNEALHDFWTLLSEEEEYEAIRSAIYYFTKTPADGISLRVMQKESMIRWIRNHPGKWEEQLDYTNSAYQAAYNLIYTCMDAAIRPSQPDNLAIEYNPAVKYVVNYFESLKHGQLEPEFGPEIVLWDENKAAIQQVLKGIGNAVWIQTLKDHVDIEVDAAECLLATYGRLPIIAKNFTKYQFNSAVQLIVKYFNRDSKWELNTKQRKKLDVILGKLPSDSWRVTLKEFDGNTKLAAINILERNTNLSHDLTYTAHMGAQQIIIDYYTKTKEDSKLSEYKRERLAALLEELDPKEYKEQLENNGNKYLVAADRLLVNCLDLDSFFHSLDDEDEHNEAARIIADYYTLPRKTTTLTKKQSEALKAALDKVTVAEWKTFREKWPEDVDLLADCVLRGNMKFSDVNDNINGKQQRDEAEQIIIDYYTKTKKKNVDDKLSTYKKEELVEILDGLDPKEWKQSLEDNGNERLAAADSLLRCCPALDYFIHSLEDEDDLIEAANIIADYYTKPKEDKVSNKLSKEAREELIELLVQFDPSLWREAIKTCNEDYDEAAGDLLALDEHFAGFARHIDRVGEEKVAKQIIIDYYTKGEGGKPAEKKKRALSKELREELDMLLHEIDKGGWFGYKSGREGDVAAAEYMLRNCEQLEDYYQKAWKEAERMESVEIIINYYTKDDGEEETMATKPQKMSRSRIKDLKEILSDEGNGFAKAWELEMREHEDQQRAARDILTKYNQTDEFWDDLPANQNEAADTFVINYFTKKGGIMGKAKDAVETAKGAAKTTKDDTINAFGIVTKMEAGDIAINNIKKAIFASLKLPAAKKKAFMEHPMVDVAVAQVAGFMMSLPEAENKMTTALHVLREGMILSSTQRVVKHFDIGQYIDKMIDGVNLDALAKLSPAKEAD